MDLSNTIQANSQQINADDLTGAPRTVTITSVEWTDERIREAFIYDGGESEYHDPINGAREQRRIAGAIFDAWLAAHDEALLASTRTEVGTE